MSADHIATAILVTLGIVGLVIPAVTVFFHERGN